MLLDAPLNPTPEEARRRLTEELLKPDYHAGSSLLQQWLDKFLTDLSVEVEAPAPWVAVVIGLALLLVAIALVLRTRRDAESRGKKRGSDLVDPQLSPADYRRLAEQALAAGQFDEATVAAFRAMVSDLDRRTVLNEKPGRTAHEVASAMASAFPAQADAFRFGADWFDLAAYGIEHGTVQRTTAAQARTLLDLGTEIAATKPVFDHDGEALAAAAGGDS